jgi:hypothetical protein
MAIAEAARRQLLREALEGRLREVRPLVRGTQPPEAPDGAADAEEALRVTMVRLVPALRAERAGRAELEALADALEGLREPARRDDLRFLDAWNNAYEALAAHPSLVAEPAAQRILAPYAGVLDEHVRRLAA